MTLRSFVIRGLALATATLLLVTGMAAPSLAVDDLLVPPSLVSFHRTSPDVVRHGDDITIDWEVQDSPAKNVIFYLRDRLGSDLQVRWDAPNGTSAYSGTARFTVDETSLATGDLTLWGFGAGNGYASVSYRTDGTIYKSPSGIQSPKAATFDYAQITTLFEADTDISVPPSLVSFHRTSPDVVRHGDDITIDWEVQDSPAKNVIFYLRDRLGSDLQVRWDAPNGTSAYSGTARFTVDETSLATGDLTLWGFGAGNGYASVSYRTDGTIYKSPSGIQSPKAATFDYAQITTLFEADTDISVPPSLVSFHRTSPDVVRHGDDITIDWEVQDSPAKNVIFYLRDRLGSDLQVRWDAPNGTSAYSGTARFTVDETSLATGDLTLWGFGAGNGYASVSYRTDGTIYKSPSGIQSPKAATFDYAQITNHVSPLTPYATTPAAVVFRDNDGTANDSYTVPAIEGVEYLIGDKVVLAGTHPGVGELSVTARPKIDYVFTEAAATQWSGTFKATPYDVMPAAVVFTDKDGTAEDTYTVPATEGVEYLVGDKAVEAGTYPGAGVVTVVARAKVDYVLKSGAVMEWKATFKATPYEVTPAAVVFTDKDGTAEDTYTVPEIAGVEYLVGDKVVEAGTYPGAGEVTVTARAKTDYVIRAGAAAEWKAMFKATPYEVTPAAVVFTDKDGTAEDTYTVPATDGVVYLFGDKVVEAGTYPGAGAVTVTARAKTDFVFKAGAVAEWTAKFKATPYEVVPVAVVFADKDGTAEDTYTIPTIEGVEYLAGGKVVEAGTYPGAAEVTVSARAKTDYAFKPGAVVEWKFTFKATPFEVVPAAVVFTDKDGTAEDSYSVPATEGVEYLVGGKVVEAGTYAGAGDVTVSARAKADYVFKAGAVTEWKFTFKATPYDVVPAAVVFADKDGTAQDTYTVPATEGMEYLVGGKVVEAGTYPGTGEVTVSARAKTDYVFKAGAVVEWSATFKATPYEVTQAAVVFMDRDGTALDTYSIPAVAGVEYLVGGKVVEAGTYPGAGEVTVIAQAKTDYAFKPGAVVEWKFTFKATPFEVVPAAVVFTDKDGTAQDSYSVPATEGVEYLVGGKVVEAGTYAGAGDVTVSARAKADYVFKAGAVTEWKFTFKATPYDVVPAAVVFTDKDGTAQDTYTVPATEGMEYLVGGKVVEAGTYPGTGEVTVSARAKTDYVFKAGAVTEWKFTFKAAPYEVVPAAVVFTDKDGSAQDTYTVPATEGVEYLAGGKVIVTGTYPGAGTVTVTARAKPDYVLGEAAAASWSITFTATPIVVTAAPVVFSDADGAAQDKYTVPATTGVEYLVGGKVIAAGSYAGNGAVTVAAKAEPDYVLKAGTATSWSFKFQSAYRFTLVVGTGDLNGDRKADVLARDSSGALWLYPGNGRGGWLARVKAGTGWNGFTAVVGPGDMNGDGKADVLARDSSGVLWLYPGSGRGGWLARVKAGTGWNGFTAVVGPGDMNGDGKADVLARDSSGVLWLYPGNGRGGWLARLKAGTGWNGFTALVGSGDMNGDRKADVLARDNGGTLWLYRGNGRGGFTSRSGAGAGWNAMASIVGARDFNGDGRNDVLAVEKTGTLWAYRGNGAGGWLGRTQAGSGWN